METPEQSLYERPQCVVRTIRYDSGLATSSADGTAGLEPFDDNGDYDW